jgi:platelet-activating factor acetylhydrolase IB subunit alpha
MPFIATKPLSWFNASQTGRIWDAQTGETKVDLRGHEKNVESVTFVPPTSYKALGELVDLGVSLI